MRTDPPYFLGKPILPLSGQVGLHMQNASMASALDERFISPGIKPLVPPFYNIDIQPSNVCPRNFVIFDQTSDRSQILFHPEVSPKYLYSGFGFAASVVQDNTIDQKNLSDERNITSTLKEDSADIDALLSMDDDYNEEAGDDDTVSTARTNKIYECNSPDSCCNYESQSSKRRSLFRKSSASRCNDKKRERVRKMVKVLKGVVPGANQMSTVDVLNEAVRYLKSLRVEVQKLGVGNSKD